MVVESRVVDVVPLPPGRGSVELVDPGRVVTVAPAAVVDVVAFGFGLVVDVVAGVEVLVVEVEVVLGGVRVPMISTRSIVAQPL